MESAPQEIQQEQLLAQMGWVRGLARSLVADPGLADDIAQDAWLAAYSAPPASIESDGQLRAWLAAVVRNLVGKSARSGTRRRGREERAARPEALESTADLVARGALHRDLTNCVMALDEPYRSTLLLRYLEGLPTADIARRQQISPAAARKRLSRATERLRTLLDAEHGGDRSAWTMALIPLIRTGPAVQVAAGTSAWALLGSSVMSTKYLALFAAAALAVLFTVTRGSDPVVPDEVSVSRADDGAISGIETALEAGERGAAVRQPAMDARAEVVILDADGEPLAGALVLFFIGEELAGDTRADTEGRAEIPESLEELSALVALRGQVPMRFPISRAGIAQVLRFERAASLAGEVVGIDAPQTLDLVLSFDMPMAVLAGVEREVLDRLAEEGIRPDRLTVRPDPAGGFRFDGLAPDWSGALLAPHGTRIVEGASHGAQLGDQELLLLEPVAGLTLPLERLVALHGRVIGEADGSPVADMLLSWRLEAGGRMAETLHQVTTDADGVFRFALPIGATTDAPWELVLRADEVYAAGASWAFDSAGVPGSGDLGELQLDLGGVASIRVLQADGAPIEGAVGTLVKERVHSLPTDPSGRASLRGVRGAPSVLVVTAPGYGIAQTSVQPGQEQVVTLEPSRSLRIEVTRPDGVAVDDLRVQILGEERAWSGPGPLSWMDVEITERQARRSRKTLEQPRALGPDGSLEIGPLRGGLRLDVILISPSGEHLESRSVVTPRDPETSEVHFVAPSTGFRISGSVRTTTGRPLPRAKVHIEASGMGEDVMTGADGGFSIGPFHSALEGVYIEVSRPGFVLRQYRDARFDALTPPLAVVMEPARRVEVELVDTLGQRVAVPYLSARLTGGGAFVAFKTADGVYDFSAIPFLAGEVVMEVAGMEVTTPIDGTQTRLTMEVPAMGTVDVRLAAGTEIARGGRMHVTLRRVIDGVAGETQRKFLARGGRAARPLAIDLPPGRYLLQLEQRVMSARKAETLGAVHTIDITAGERQSLVLP